MPLKKLLLITAFIFTAGCLNNNHKADYKAIKDIHLTLGDLHKSIGQLYFEINEESKLSFLIYVDHLPFKKTINLCPKTGVYRRVNTLFKSFKDGKEHIEYINDKANCESTILIQKNSNTQVYLDYSIRRLLGYFEEKALKHDSKMPFTRYYQGRVLLKNNQQFYASKKYNQKGDLSSSIQMKFSYKLAPK